MKLPACPPPSTARRGLPALVAVLAITGTAACNPKPPDEGDYVSRIMAARAEKDKFFQDDQQSPVPDTRKGHFLPLEYYPVDPAYNLPARLSPPEKEEVIEMTTSTGTVDKLRRAGAFEFTIQGQTLRLEAFVAAGSAERLFVPFRDTTAGEETYGSGRYLELDRSSSGVYQLDFNTAFNPYCYYNLAYICPLPPKENRLPIAIRAGERVKPDVKTSAKGAPVN
jgi:uncharacterized protein (DUF1684 family)